MAAAASAALQPPSAHRRLFSLAQALRQQPASGLAVVAGASPPAVRIAVVGCGSWGMTNHLPYLCGGEMRDGVVAEGLPSVAVVAVVDTSAERRAAACEKFGIAASYATVEELLQTERVDGLVICSAHVSHYSNCLPAVHLGIPCMVEKPMTATTADARALVAAAQGAGAELLVPCGWNFRWYSEKAAEMVAAGVVGDVQHVVCHMASSLEDLFAGRTDASSKATWADKTRAGGYGWGQMSHSLAWVFQVSGLKPESVYCVSGQAPETGVDYYSAAAVRCRSGATISLSGAATIPSHVAQLTANSHGFHLDVRIFGSAGVRRVL